MTLRSAVRAASPMRLRIAVALTRRAWSDSRLGGTRPRLAAKEPAPATVDLSYRVVEVVQEIRKSAFFEGKVANLRLGARLLDGVVIAPGETLSFWKLVGRPSQAAGFVLGRAIRGGAVGGDVGGGLCQLSGLIYETGLRAGLDPAERHPHSRDLYEEQDRFTPLGLDAAIVWPYKDLRLANPFTVPVQLRIVVRDLAICASIHAPAPLAASSLEIERIDRIGRREVRVSRRTIAGHSQLISDDIYPFRPLPPP
jgi:vancomycin resistance protein VanW